ncbi:hypothetical protein [Halobacillus faecis]
MNKWWSEEHQIIVHINSLFCKWDSIIFKLGKVVRILDGEAEKYGGYFPICNLL